MNSLNEIAQMSHLTIAWQGVVLFVVAVAAIAAIDHLVLRRRR